jgi:hypothetical protein
MSTAVRHIFVNGTPADGTFVNDNFTDVCNAVDGVVPNQTHTGDVTGATSLTISNGVVTAAKLGTDINTKVLTGGAVKTITDGATLSVDWSNGSTQGVTLGGNRTFNAPTNAVAGQVYRLILIQDATGSRTVTWWGGIKWADGTQPTLTTTAYKADIVTMLYDGVYYYASASLNF